MFFFFFFFSGRGGGGGGGGCCGLEKVNFLYKESKSKKKILLYLFFGMRGVGVAGEEGMLE